MKFEMSDRGMIANAIYDCLDNGDLEMTEAWRDRLKILADRFYLAEEQSKLSFDIKQAKDKAEEQKKYDEISKVHKILNSSEEPKVKKIILKRKVAR